jgi:very-short-patch-repair endonuclease
MGRSIISNTEKVLAKQMSKMNIPFRKQEKIGPYRIDFFVSPNVIVEVEGWYHFSPQASERDHARQRYLEGLGNVVVRLSGVDVLSDPKGSASIVIDARKNPDKYRTYQVKQS